jgi:hypothetical protein
MDIEYIGNKIVPIGSCAIINITGRIAALFYGQNFVFAASCQTYLSR